MSRWVGNIYDLDCILAYFCRRLVLSSWLRCASVSVLWFVHYTHILTWGWVIWLTYTYSMIVLISVETCIHEFLVHHIAYAYESFVHCLRCTCVQYVLLSSCNTWIWFGAWFFPIIIRIGTVLLMSAFFPPQSNSGLAFRVNGCGSLGFWGTQDMLLRNAWDVALCTAQVGCIVGSLLCHSVNFSMPLFCRTS